MRVEREIAGFVLPFSAGILLFSGLGLIHPGQFHHACISSFAVMSAILLVLMHPVHLRFEGTWTWIMIALLGLSAGIFIGVISGLGDISSPGSELLGYASGFGLRFGDFIDGIPFGDDGTNALLKALITGERNGISRTVADAFRESGASHILSLSGFHLGIVYGIARWSLSWLGNSPRVSRLRSVMTILLCGFYTLATGAGPSIVRAFLFILLGETARMANRPQTTAGLLLSSLLIQLVLSPSSIRSVSFQLSYVAMAGIAWIYPRLRDFWPGNPSDDRLFIRGVRRAWNSAALSLACQLTTGPLAYFYFGSFPRYFLLTNLIAVPLTAILIPVGLAAVILSSFGICPDFLLDATDLLSSALSDSLRIIATM